MNSAISAIDDTDRALVHALQLAPRASWERLAQVIGARPETLARRWERLSAAGDAWISGLGLRTGTQAPCMAWVEVTCAAGAAPAVGAALTGDAHTMGVEHTTGARDLMAFVAVPDLHMLHQYLSFRVQRIPGVVATRSSVVTAVHASPDRWRLDQLTPAQADLLTGRGRRRAAAAPAPVAPMPEEDRPLVLALASDARRSVASLARESGMSESTVRRRLSRLEAGHSLRYSCAMASGLTGWPVSATVWAEVPEHEVADCAAVATGLRETRTCMSVSGRRNVVIGARLRTVEELSRYTADLTRRMPGLRVADTVVALHVRKSEAQELDRTGRRVRTVRPDIWTDTAPEAWDDALPYGTGRPHGPA
ncbi:Lrp/AsnC family transcriptional regulator [Streptomyces sp. NPDC090077]|uniref:Lrp/AsnC family transcriptional regulator n=1 Tax=Streptomyces sp. NPDC090077 TaxID=3365938 RepID=UPI00382DC9C5